jgi:signal transduction histidine kinase
VFRGEGTATEVDAATATQLYRIAQEAISNAVRHGRPRRVLLDLVAVGGRVIMSIEDDGVGLPDPVPQHGLGLRTMSYRARAIGGSLVIDRRTPTGTVVTCSVELRAAPNMLPAPEGAGPVLTPTEDRSHVTQS